MRCIASAEDPAYVVTPQRQRLEPGGGGAS
jgi:hypothetical protein